MKFESGFTFIEILIVMVIMGIIAGVGVANFRDFGRRQEIDNLTRQVAGDLRLAQVAAAGGQKNSSCTGAYVGTRIDFTAVAAASGGSTSTRYQIFAACATTSSVIKDVTLTGSQFLALNRTPTAGIVSLLFKPLEQGTDVPIGNNFVITTSNSLTVKTDTITITSSGEIR